MHPFELCVTKPSWVIDLESTSAGTHGTKPIDKQTNNHHTKQYLIAMKAIQKDYTHCCNHVSTRII
jgi:hypothetical protein